MPPLLRRRSPAQPPNIFRRIQPAARNRAALLSRLIAIEVHSMPLSFRPCLALLTGGLLLVPPSVAFNTPLSDQAVREAYFLGQRRDESMADFLNQYTKVLPRPKTGPHIASVTFLTPFALLVEYSSRQADYSAQRALSTTKPMTKLSKSRLKFCSHNPTAPSSPRLLIRGPALPSAFSSVPPTSGAPLSTASSTATKRSPPMTSPANPSTSAPTVVAFSPAPSSTSGSLPPHLPPTPPPSKSLPARATPSPSTSTSPLSAEQFATSYSQTLLTSSLRCSRITFPASSRMQ